MRMDLAILWYGCLRGVVRNRLPFSFGQGNDSSRRITKILLPGLTLILRPPYYNNIYPVELSRVLDPGLIALKIEVVLFIIHTDSVSCKVFMNFFSYRWISRIDRFYSKPLQFQTGTALFITFLLNNTFVIWQNKGLIVTVME